MLRAPDAMDLHDSRLTSSCRTVSRMYHAVTCSQLFVLDQDEAIDFYVNKLGLEVSADLDLGFMRWLTVRVPGDPRREILLEKPGPPAMDEATAALVRQTVAKGAGGGWLCITTDNAQSTYETLFARGIDITDEPAPRPYGIDFGIRDRIGQMFDQRS
jgi:catechol 2,3-dioxygenase-like lactoylglutathione lyase family enzyme